MDDWLSVLIVAGTGVGGTVIGTILGYFLKIHGEKQERESRISNLRELLYTEISRNFGKLNSVITKIDADLNPYVGFKQTLEEDENFAKEKLEGYFIMLGNLSRFDAYNYAKLNPDLFFQLEKSEYTHIEEIYEYLSSMPGELKTKIIELSSAIYPKTKDRILHLEGSIWNIIYGSDNKLKNLIKGGLDKNLFSKVTKKPDEWMLYWIFNSNN